MTAAPALDLVSGRVGEPPYNLEAERSVLGAVLIRERMDAVAFLRPDDFLLPAHSEIWEAMLAVAKNDRPVDVVTLASELRDRRILTRLDGGEGYLLALFNSVPTAENAPHYARIVRDNARGRRAGAVLADGQSRLHAGANVDEVIQETRNAIARLELGKDEKPIERWPDPTPLPSGLPAVPQFPELLMPITLRPWISDIAARMQCPPDFVAATAMVGLGSVLGRSCGIKPRRKDDWLVIANLWGAVVGRPGIMKTPAIDQGLAPIMRLAADAQTRFASSMKDAEFSTQVLEARKAEARKRLAKAQPEELCELRQTLETEAPSPVARRYLVSDATVEKLGLILRDNPSGVMHFRDELTGWFSSMLRDGHEGDRAFFLESWSGSGSYTFDRVGRGTIHIPATCVSVFGGIQPGPLAAYLKAALRGGQSADGLLQRFQMTVWPDPTTWRHVDRWPDSAARTNAFATFTRFSDLNADSLGIVTGEFDSVPALHFSDVGQEFFDEWLGDLEHRLRGGGEHEAFEAHLSKFKKLMPGLALLCHLADANGSPGPVSVEAAQRAAAWCTYLEGHARRLYASCMKADDVAAAALLEKIRAGEAPSPVVARDIYRRCWSGLSTLDDVDGALSVLESHGFVRRVDTPTGGRPRVEYLVHPSLRPGGKA